MPSTGTELIIIPNAKRDLSRNLRILSFEERFLARRGWYIYLYLFIIPKLVLEHLAKVYQDPSKTLIPVIYSLKRLGICFLTF